MTICQIITPSPMQEYITEIWDFYHDQNCVLIQFPREQIFMANMILLKKLEFFRLLFIDNPHYVPGDTIILNDTQSFVQKIIQSLSVR